MVETVLDTVALAALGITAANGSVTVEPSPISGNGDFVYVRGGRSTDAAGGNVIVASGEGVNGGVLTLGAGVGFAAGGGGNVGLNGGNGFDTAYGGAVVVTGGSSAGSTAGNVEISGGIGATSSGKVQIAGGQDGGGGPGAVEVYGGGATDGDRNGANILLRAGDGNGTGLVGLTKIANLPTAAPADNRLSAKDMTFYLNEGSNKLMVKLKYANGTVKSAELALT